MREKHQLHRLREAELTLAAATASGSRTRAFQYRERVWQPKVFTPRVAYVESDDEYGEDEDAEWQGRSPLYPHIAWDRRERRAHVTNLLGGQWQLHTNDVMGNWN